MKKTLAILLAFACVLALSVIAFAEDISDVLSSEPEESMVESIAEADAETEAEIVTDSPASENAPAEDAPAEDVPAEDEPAEDVPAEDVPAEDVPAEDVPANEPVHISGADGYSAEELEMLDAVLGKRTGTGYSSWSFDKYGNLCEGSDYCNYELSAEIAEKYGTRDSLLLPPIMIYESIGELDATETLRYDFYRWGENGEEIFVKSETFTIEIPAGSVVFYPLDINPDDLRDQGFDTARGVIVSATYGNLSIVFDS